MPKKSSYSKKPSQSEEKSMVEQATPVAKPGKLGNEIDDIFGKKKRKKSELEKTEKKTDRDTKQSTEENTLKKNKKKRRKGENLDCFSNPPTRPRKRTEDGLAVYTEDELGINKGNAGGTPLCPFDCDCCF